MTLSELPSEATVFVDANIFLYHFTGTSEECKEFLKGCAQGRFNAVTSTTVLAEVCHRLMAIEAVKHGWAPSKQPAAYLQKHPAIVKRLSEYYVQMTQLMSWGIQVVPAREHDLTKSHIYRQRFGLLTQDSMIPVAMEEAGTGNLASADKMFDAIDHLQRYAPSDLLH